MADVVFYEHSGKKIELTLEGETIWMTQKGIGDLFGIDRSVISRHLQSIFDEGELDRDKNSRVTFSGNSDRKLIEYNLEAIISVGYRVNSLEGTRFRQWANKVLRDHIVNGMSLNQKRLQENLGEAVRVFGILKDVLRQNISLEPSLNETLSLVDRYSSTWSTLLQFDEKSISTTEGHPVTQEMPYETLRKKIDVLAESLQLKGEASSLFGAERGEAFRGILGSLDQTMFGEPLYRTREEKAANLLYLVIKDHPFSDGNKRIGSFLFLDYLNRERMPLPEPETVTAFALLVAESQPSDKDLMIRMAMKMIPDSPKDLEINQDEEMDTGNSVGPR